MSYDNIYTRRVSYGENVRNSFKNAFSGIIIFLLSFVLLFWNEWHSMQQIKKMNFMSKHAIEVPVDLINNANDNKLIATSGVATTDATLNDGIVSVNNALALKRIVEMYQWKEDSDTDSNGYKTYNYKKVWSSDLIDSSTFDNSSYTNPNMFPYNSETYVFDDVKVGNYVLTDEQKRMLPANKTYTLSNNLTQELPSGFSVYNDYITNTSDINNPNIGDIRIMYKYNDYENISVLAGQNGDKFVKFEAPNGGTIYRFENGILDKAQLLQSFKNDNNMMKWLFRGLGIVLIFIGYLLISGPISTISSFVPILGNLVGAATGLLSFLVALAHSFIVIAIAWFRFRPILAIGLITFAVIAVVLIIVFINNHKNKNNIQIN